MNGYEFFNERKYLFEGIERLEAKEKVLKITCAKIDEYALSTLFSLEEVESLEAYKKLDKYEATIILY